MEENSPLVQGRCPESRATQQPAGGARFLCSAAECWAWHHELCIARSLRAQGFLVQAQVKQRVPLHCSEHSTSITPKRSAASCAISKERKAWRIGALGTLNSGFVLFFFYLFFCFKFLLAFTTLAKIRTYF